MAEYRLPLFERLRDRLAARDIALDVLYGDATRVERTKGDGGDLSWGRRIPTRYLLNGRVCWQPFGAWIGDADLIVIAQENKLLFNHWLLMHRPRARIAFWGHGKNMQSNKPSGLAERIKRWSVCRVHWWFAYSDLTRDIVLATGFPRERICVLNNSVDTSRLMELRQAISDKEMADARSHLGLETGPIGIYVGSLYADKRIDFLIAAARRVREHLSSFHLLMVGGGPESERHRAATRSDQWIHWMGVRRDKEKVALLAMSDLMLIPAAVGLAILDSFALRVPLLTTCNPGHGPEIAYLHNGVNGVMTAPSAHAYAAAVVRILRNPDELAQLKAGCAASATLYAVENMAERFADGIAGALYMEDGHP